MCAVVLMSLTIVLTLSVFTLVYFITCKYTHISQQKAYDDFWFYSMLTIWTAICIYGVSINCASLDDNFVACIIISFLFILGIQFRNWRVRSKNKEEYATNDETDNNPKEK